MKRKITAFTIRVALLFAVIASAVVVPNTSSFAKVALSSVIWASSKGPPPAKMAAGSLLVIELFEVMQRDEQDNMEVREKLRILEMLAAYCRHPDNIDECGSGGQVPAANRGPLTRAKTST